MKHITYLFSVLSLVLCAHIPAATADIKVKQVNTTSGNVVLEASDDQKIEANSNLLVNLPDGKQCPLSVTNVNGKLISADSSACKDRAEIKKGQDAEVELIAAKKKVEPAPSPSPTPAPTPTPVPSATPVPVAAPPAQPENSRRLHVSAFLYLNSGNQMTFDSISASSGGGPAITGSATFSMESAGGLGIELWQSDPHSWGWSGGMLFESKRKINSATMTAGAGTAIVNYAEPKATVGFWDLYGNAIYRWERMYLPFGLNVAVPDFKDAPGATGSFTMSAGLGFQVGFGYHFTDSFSMEFYSRVIAVKASAATSTYSYDLKSGYMPSGQLNFRWDFY